MNACFATKFTNGQKRQMQIYHRGRVGTEVKPRVSVFMRVARNNSLTQCIIFIPFMNFMVKKAVLCALSVLCGKKMYFFVSLRLCAR